MKVLIVGISALGGTIAARAINAGVFPTYFPHTAHALSLRQGCISLLRVGAPTVSDRAFRQKATVVLWNAIHSAPLLLLVIHPAGDGEQQQPKWI